MDKSLIYIVEVPMMLRDFLKDKISGKALKKIKQHGHIYVNGSAQTVRYQLDIGDEVQVIYPKESKGKQMKAIEMDLDICYEDDYFLVINKVKGVPCIPDHRYDYSLANGILYYYQSNNINTTIHFVNRLDKDTSGLLLIAKYAHEHYLMSNQQIIRKYHAIVLGKLNKEDNIIAPIYRESLNVKRVISEKGKYAETYYRVLSNNEELSLIECILKTGRTHQIRVHLAHIGHPLLGDSLYGEKMDTNEGQFLHSYYLSFYHPYLKKKIEITRDSHFNKLII